MRTKNLYQCDSNCKNCDYVNKKPTGYGVMDECATDNCPKGNYKIGVVDKLGGRHVEGYGWNPLGEFCNFCKHDSCENCIKWSNRDKKLRNNIPAELKQRKPEPKKEEKKIEVVEEVKKKELDIVEQARKIMEQEKLAKENKTIPSEINDTFVERETISDSRKLLDDFDMDEFENDNDKTKQENKIPLFDNSNVTNKNDDDNDNDNDNDSDNVEEDDIDFGMDDIEIDEDEPEDSDYPDISFDEDDIPAPDDYNNSDDNDDNFDEDDEEDNVYKKSDLWERKKNVYQQASYMNDNNDFDEDDEDDDFDEDDDKEDEVGRNFDEIEDDEDFYDDDDDEDDDFDEDDDSEFDLYEQTKRLKASILFAEGTKIAKYQVRNKGVYLTTVGDAKVTVKGRNDSEGFSYCDAKKFPRYVREGILNGELYRNENIHITDNTNFCFIYFQEIDGELIEKDRKNYKTSIENASEDKIRRLLCKAFNDFENK